MTDVIASETAKPAGDRLLVKIDAEGAECEIVLQTPLGVWQSVDEVFIEFHEFAACSQDQIVDHLEHAGLVLVDERFGVIHLSARSATGLARPLEDASALDRLGRLRRARRTS